MTEKIYDYNYYEWLIVMGFHETYLILYNAWLMSDDTLSKRDIKNSFKRNTNFWDRKKMIDEYNHCNWLYQMCLYETYIIFYNGWTTTKYNEDLYYPYIPNTNKWDKR